MCQSEILDGVFSTSNIATTFWSSYQFSSEVHDVFELTSQLLILQLLQEAGNAAVL